MDKNTKHAQSAALREVVADAPALVLVDYGGLTVDQVDDLRNKFREAGCTYRVYKNSVVRYAVEGTDHEALTPFLKGMNGLAFNVDDPGAPARVARDFAKENDKLELKGGCIEGDALDPAGLLKLADMPGPRELKAKLLNLFNTPATNMVRVLAAPARDFLNVLNAKKDKDAA